MFYQGNKVSINGNLYSLPDVTIDGTAYTTTTDLRTALDLKVFRKGGGAGGNGGVQWSDTSATAVGGKVPVYSEQGLLSTGTPLFPENAVPLSYFNMMLGREGVLHLPEGTSESFNLSDIGNIDINVDGEGAKLTFTSAIDGIKYLKLNIFNGFEISTKFFNGVLNDGEVDTELPSQGVNINGGYAELIYHTSMSHARVFKLTISNNGQDATWSDRSL